MLRVCISCGVEKDEHKEFRKNFRGYIDKTCKKCRNAESTKWAKDNYKPAGKDPVIDRHSYCMYCWLMDKPGSLAHEVL